MPLSPDPNTNPFQPLTLSELAGWHPPTPPEIISNGLLPKGHIMFLYGEQETWKSWLAMDLVFSVASKTQWLVYRTQPVKCIIVNPEIPAPAYKDRIDSYLRARNPNVISDDLLRFWTNLDLRIDDGTGRSALLQWVKTYEPDLIVIDGLEFVCKGDVSTGITASAIRDTINLIRATHNCAFVFVHHKKKGLHDQYSGKRIDIGIDDMYGHSIIKNLADTLIMVEKNPDDEDLVKLHNMKTRMSKVVKPHPVEYRFNRNKLQFEISLMAELAL